MENPWKKWRIWGTPMDWKPPNGLKTDGRFSRAMPYFQGPHAFTRARPRPRPWLLSSIIIDYHSMSPQIRRCTFNLALRCRMLLAVALERPAVWIGENSMSPQMFTNVYRYFEGPRHLFLWYRCCGGPWGSNNCRRSRGLKGALVLGWDDPRKWIGIDRLESSKTYWPQKIVYFPSNFRKFNFVSKNMS